LLSLQIIQPESHPNAFNQGPRSTGSKGSLSIYGLFHHLAHTSQGRTRLRQLFLRPSLDLEEINTRLDFVSVFVQHENTVALEKLSKSLAKIKNMRTTTTLLRKGINQKYGGFKSGVWASLLEFAYHTIDIRNTLLEVIGGENLPLHTTAMEILDVQKLQRIGKAIHEVVDLEPSIEQHRTVVKRGINERLDEVKDIYDGMDDLLSKAAVAITRTLPADFQSNLNVIYFPQLGYHITVPINAETGQPIYDGGDAPWERMFTTQNQVYFNDNGMREMDEQLCDLWAMICGSSVASQYLLT
jgi:DNA mismatch repair protein MSH5